MTGQCEENRRGPLTPVIFAFRITVDPFSVAVVDQALNECLR